MPREVSHVWKERGFLFLLAVMCAVITALQFKWTGELAKAEFERLGENQREGARRLAQAFDRELSGAVKQLTPSSNEFNTKTVAKSMQNRVKRWRMSSPRPLFRKLAVVVPEEGMLKLFGMDPAKGTTAEIEWPVEWSALREDFTMKLGRRNVLFGMGVPGDGTLFEVPVHRRPGRGPGGEAGWLIAELDRSYLKNTYFPELVELYLHPGVRDLYEINVTDSQGETVYTKGSGGDPESEIDVAFNLRGRDAKGGGPPGPPVWNLEVKRTNQELERIVAASRKRNLALAFAVNGLILAAGIALVRHTRRSRLLAEAQMDFVANVSHELRTPVTVITGAAHNLKRGIIKGPEAIERYACMILQHSEQLSEMVQEVVEFSVAKKGRCVYAKVPVDAAEVLRQAIDEAKADTAGMVMQVSISVSLPKVLGDPTALRRAFGNVIRNAAKHGRQGGWIGVSAVRGTKGDLVVEISDRGPGIPESEKEEVFKPFFRGEAAHEGQIRGSGLGLGLVKEIVVAHRGEVSVCSEPGNGATFVIRLPAMAAVADERENPAG